MLIFGVIFVGLVCTAISEDLDEGCVDITKIAGKVIPPKVISVRRSGNLYSPGFEKNQNYPDLVQCSYQLQAPLGMHVRLHFNVLDIDVTDGCGADFLQIYDFNSRGEVLLKFVICGNQTPYDFVSQSRIVQLFFITDDFVGRRGFNVTYSLQTATTVCAYGLKQCRNRNCVDYLKVCDGSDDCGDGTDEENCPGVELETSVCGKPDIQPDLNADHDRIVGGKEAVDGGWPWMADLQANIIQPNGHTCGGTLINAQWVLTAAHCFMQPILRRASGWRIHLGNYRKFERDDHEQIRYAERIVFYNIPNAIFEKDGKFDINDDVALIKLNAPVKFTKYVKPVCLPDAYMELNQSSICYATGWGISRGSGSSPLLKQAYHPIQPDVLCKRLVGDQFQSKTMICAGSVAPLNGVCHGDSGGPLACKRDEVWTIVGVASFVTDTNGIEGLCGLKERPSAFNKVAVKTDWIRRMINRYS